MKCCWVNAPERMELLSLISLRSVRKTFRRIGLGGRANPLIRHIRQNQHILVCNAQQLPFVYGHIAHDGKNRNDVTCTNGRNEKNFLKCVFFGKTSTTNKKSFRKKISSRPILRSTTLLRFGAVWVCARANETNVFAFLSTRTGGKTKKEKKTPTSRFENVSVSWHRCVCMCDTVHRMRATTWRAAKKKKRKIRWKIAVESTVLMAYGDINCY